jgi:hypothetical protein
MNEFFQSQGALLKTFSAKQDAISVLAPTPLSPNIESADL